MGCDIRVHFEIKLNGKWEHYSQSKFKRNHRLFGKMAGVRNDYNEIPICEPKGLPIDISFMSKFCSDYMGSDDHNHSWFDKEEIKKIHEFHEKIDNGMIDYKQWGYLFGGCWDDFVEYREDYPKEIEDIRMIFGFDG